MKLHERIDLRLSSETYSALLIEAGGNARDVPDLIRTKLDGRTHADETRAALKFATEMLKLLYLDCDNAVVKNERREAIQRLLFETGLNRF
jgi:hypothetical protein